MAREGDAGGVGTQSKPLIHLMCCTLPDFIKINTVHFTQYLCFEKPVCILGTRQHYRQALAV